MKSFNQSPHFTVSVVHAKRGARRGRHTEAFHKRLGAMVPGANGDAFLVENGPDIVRMDTLHDKRNNAGLFSRRADQPNAGNLTKARVASASSSCSWAAMLSRPSRLIYSRAALRPMTPEMSGVPASNLCGSLL